MKQKILYTPKEIFLRNPILQKYWTPNAIGYLFKMQLVSGRRGSKYSYIDEDDVLRLFYFRFPSLMQK